MRKIPSCRLLKKNFTRMRPDILHARIVFMEKMVNFASAEQKKELELAKSIKEKKDKKLKSYQEECDLLLIEHLLNAHDINVASRR
jgi:hypothetical protein